MICTFQGTQKKKNYFERHLWITIVAYLLQVKIIIWYEKEITKNNIAAVHCEIN